MTCTISDCNNISDNNSKEFYRHPQYLLVLDLDDIFHFLDVYLDITLKCGCRSFYKNIFLSYNLQKSFQIHFVFIITN